MYMICYNVYVYHLYNVSGLPSNKRELPSYSGPNLPLCLTRFLRDCLLKICVDEIYIYMKPCLNTVQWIVKVSRVPSIKINTVDYFPT